MISWKDVKELIAFKNGDAWVSTLMLNIDGRHFPKREEYMVVFKNLVKETRAQIDQAGLTEAARQSIEQDFQKMERYLLDQFERNHHRGLLIYACSKKDLWQPFAFPIPLRSKLVVQPHPYTLPLTALLDEYPKYCVVSVSQERARIFEVYLGEIVERSDIYDEVPGKVHDPASKEFKADGPYGRPERRIERRGRRSDSPIGGGNSESGVYGLAERKIERHIETHVRRHFKRIAEITFSFFKDDHFDWLLLGGQTENLAAFEDILHSDLKSRIIGRLKADPKASLPSLHEESLRLIQKAELQQRDQLIRRIAEVNYPDGLGVLGVTPTLQALKQRVVQTLVIQSATQLSGTRCTVCNHMTFSASNCPDCGGMMEPVDDLMEEVVEEAISQSAQIVHVPQHPILEQSGGIGALLRYQPAKNTNLAKGAA
ncbi:MAG: hypothetical protein EPO39_01620 [Candidatus Manganitrophaceae bacterium]|nr:MAG: hypothetical protein EPO39_01620 [Candidatus Manganitrophaceae bacterium]